MAARQAQFFIITAVLISGIIIAVSSVTPTYYISQQDQTLKIGLLADSIDGVTESALGAVDIGNLGKKKGPLKYWNKFQREITTTISQLRYNDITLELNDIVFGGHVTGRLDARTLNSTLGQTLMPASIVVGVSYNVSSPSFRLNYTSSFTTSIRVAGTGPGDGAILFKDVAPDTDRLILPLYFEVNGDPYEFATFEIGKIGRRNAVVTITDVTNNQNGIYVLTIEFSTGPGGNDTTRNFHIETYTAKGARTDLRIRV